MRTKGILSPGARNMGALESLFIQATCVHYQYFPQWDKCDWSLKLECSLWYHHEAKGIYV